MRLQLRFGSAWILLASVVVATELGTARGLGDEPSRLGRFFRFGNNAPPAAARDEAPPSAFPGPAASPPLLPPPSTPPAPGESGPRLIPQPRVSRAVTESDPILTRIAIGRSDNGTRFGMFLQVYADGTVLDGEGVHHLGRETLKPLVEAIQSGDVFRLRGHCGGPPADFVEQVQIVVYERSLGRLRANSFSYSGNPQGCDHAIRHIQAAVDAIQNKISGVPAAAPAPNATVPASPAPSATPPANAPTIPLTPIN